MPVDTTGWTRSRGGGGLVVIGRLTSQKRVHLAVRAARIIADRGRPVPLTIIGDGPERPSLERESALAPQAPVRFLGTRSPADVIATLERADACLFPAEQEGFGLAAIEALMMGVPVVACADGGGVVSALARFGGGLTVGAGPDSIADGIEQALVPAARERAREAGVRWRDELAPDRVAQRFEGWYVEALAR